MRVMRVTRVMRGLGAATAVVLMLGAGAGPAMAGTADTGGTAAITLWGPVVSGLAKAGIAVLPGPSGTATDIGGRERVTLPVVGGNADYVTATGQLDLGSSLVFIDGATGKTATLRQLRFSYGSAKINGVPAGHARISLVAAGGALSATTNPGPPVSQSFRASALLLTPAGASYLDKELHTKYFRAGRDIGEFAATYDTESTT
jgi:hypothetical protein